MILSLMKCKICGKVISPPDQALIIGESAPARNQRILQALFSHIQGQMETERNQPAQPHTAALIGATVAGENLKGAMLVGCFEVSPDMEMERQDVLRRVHEITRTVRMSDEDLMEYAPRGYHGLVEIRWIDALKDLRDRYEGLGKYAPSLTTAPQESGTDEATSTARARSK